MRVRPLCSVALPLAVFLSMSLAACGGSDGALTIPAASAAPAGTKATLAVLETADLHTDVLSYDYFKLTADNSLGFERVVTLINQVRTQFPNTPPLDNGGTIQGTTLSDYQAMVSPIICDQALAIYKVMNAAKYDGGGIGNHELSYGSPYLLQVTGNTFNVDGLPDPATQKKCVGPTFPQMLTDVVSVKTNVPFFQPYTIITKTITATAPDGNTISVPVKVGITSFTPPIIMSWDKRWLDGKVYTVGIKETAAKYISEMRAKGADLVVAISYGGLDNLMYSPTMENGSWWLSTVPGIDAMLVGHSYQPLPDIKSTVSQFNLPGVDKVVGTVNGVSTVMVNYRGRHLGVIKLGLTFNGTNWAVDKMQTTVEVRSIQDTDKTYIAADLTVSAAIATEHQATINYVKTPVGSTDLDMSMYFADAGDPGTIETVNQAQADYVSAYIQANLPQYASLPVLSVSVPFKNGFGGGTDFTDAAAGPLTINNTTDLYLYLNTVCAVKVAGSDIKNWPGTAAKRFNTIDPTQVTVQKLASTFPGCNFGMFITPGLTCEIDVTQPASSCIKNLMYKGAALDPAAQFIVATNNYHASGGGNFPGLDGSKTIYVSPDANRDVLISCIKKVSSVKRATNGLQRSWRFTKLASSVAQMQFASTSNKLAGATAAGITNVIQVVTDDGSGKGSAVHQIDLTQ